jgi:WD40 repeat protein
MSKPPLEQLEALFHEAADLEPEERSAFLDARCAGDPELRSAVEDLLQQETGAGRTASFLVSPLARPDASTVTPSASGQANTPPAAPTIPGHEVLGELGRGGMGVVYKVRQTARDRVVALKMLLTDAPVTAERLARFRIEMDALKRLQHPNIVQIDDVGEAEGRPYFTMEYVAGPNLAQKLAGEPLAPPRAAHLVEVLADAIEAVHRCHVLHRDLKPANILLSTEVKVLSTESPKTPRSVFLSTQHSVLSTAVPKITDFGLAKLVNEPADGAGRLTKTGQAMGTPCYMAPEQARGETRTLGPATDVYALGVILYEALTGRPPFEGTTAVDTINRVLDEDPVSPAVLQPSLPRDLVTICLKCLEKDPRRRYVAARDLAEDLRRFQTGTPILGRPVSRAEHIYRWCRRRPAVAGLLGLSAALVVALVVTVLVYNARLREELTAEQKLTETERRQLVQLNVAIAMRDVEGGDAFTALLRLTEALRLDENKDQAGERKQRIRIATTLRQCPELVHLLACDGPVLAVRQRPGGGWLVAVGEGASVRVWEMNSGKPAGPTLTAATAVHLAALSADGRLIACAGADNTVRVWDVTSGAPLTPRLPHGEAIRCLALHASGQVVLTTRADGVVEVWDLSARKPIRLQGLPVGAPSFFVFSDDGRWVFCQATDHLGQVWDAGTGKAVGPPFPLTQAVTCAAFGLDGRRIALATSDNAVRVRDVLTGEMSSGPWHCPRPVTRLAFGPAGDRLLTVGADHTAWVWPTTNGRLPLVSIGHTSAVTQARFSPDGRLLVTGGDDNHVRVWDTTTGEAVTPLLLHNGRITYAAFSADGKEILTAAKDGVVRCWRLRPAPGAAAGKPIVREPPAAPREAMSPDGRRILRWQGTGVQVTDVATGAPVGSPLRHRSTVEYAAFSPDGRRIVTAGDDNMASVWDAGTGAPVLAPTTHQGTIHHAAFSPDGGSLITGSADHTARVWDATTGEALTPPLAHPSEVMRAEISLDGSQAVTIGADGLQRTWDLTPANESLQALRRLAQVLAGSRIDEQNRLVPLAGEELRSAWREQR